ncbi:MAG TPA: hypothetical protein VGM05_17750 [Planctomycetaceae bacterium]
MWDRSLFAAALLLSISSLSLAAEGEAAAPDQSVSAKSLAGDRPNDLEVQSAGKESAEKNASAEEEDASGPRYPRVLYISMKGCPACSRELARLRRPGGDFDGMRAKGWKIGTTSDCHVQIVDRDAIPELIVQFGIQSYPTVICVSKTEIVRSFKSGCTTPLDSWTFGFLLNGQNERPKGSIPEAARVAWTGSYPLRGTHWSIDGDWTPTRDRVVGHLRSTHGGQIAATYAIESWSVEELKSLHDDLHEREIGAVGTAGYSYSAGSYQQPTRTINFSSAGHKMGF